MVCKQKCKSSNHCISQWFVNNHYKQTVHSDILKIIRGGNQRLLKAKSQDPATSNSLYEFQHVKHDDTMPWDKLHF